ncbi:MAG: HisA/HisF-related TIM barrel protein [Methanobacterium sp. ERen5]|nr:MAG: HisA/HisF-related TIM barrel protein [Methanobacterium sp. ERen5]
MAEALKTAGYSELYIADLDSIEGTGSNQEIVKKINKTIPVMLDAGITNHQDIEAVVGSAEKIIVATETLESMEEIGQIFSLNPKNSLVLSVDLVGGEVLSKNMKLNSEDVMGIIEKHNPAEVIILDVSRVGTNSGFDEAVVDRFKHTETQLIVGGGVTKATIKELEKIGVNKFLVGTAIHNGDL